MKVWAWSLDWSDFYVEAARGDLSKEHPEDIASLQDVPDELWLRYERAERALADARAELRELLVPAWEVG